MTRSRISPAQVGRFPRLRHVVWLTTIFWRSRDSATSWVLSVGLISLQGSTTYLFLWKNDWDRQLFDAIATRSGLAVPHLLASFSIIIGATIASQLLQSFLIGYVALRWRTWLNANYVSRWFAANHVLDIERVGIVDNPDQRIAEDIEAFTTLF